MVANLPIRLIAADRPGYGLSDPHPEGTFCDRAQDIAALADHLGIEQFPIVGVSGGGPLAAACAFYVNERVTALTLISAVPPPEAITAGGLGLLMRLGRNPLIGRAALSLVRPVVRSVRAGMTLVFGGKLPLADAKVLTTERRAQLLACMHEGLRQGIAGALADASLFGRPWGFALSDIAVPTTVWHGLEDQLVAPASAQAFAAIPGAVLHILPGHGHYSLALGETAPILTDLLRMHALRGPPGIAAVPG